VQKRTEASRETPQLPETAQIIADVIGRELTLKLAAVARHRAVYIPKQMPRSHWVAGVVGIEAADKLVSAFGGMLLTLAKCSNLARRERNKRIWRLHKANLRPREIASMLRVSVSTVQHVLAGLKQARPSDF
jgi:hypothetical protein